MNQRPPRNIKNYTFLPYKDSVLLGSAIGESIQRVASAESKFS